MVIFQMVDTPPWTHPLTCPEETEKEYEVNTSCFLIDRQGRTRTSSSPSPPPASSLLEVCFTSLTPNFPHNPPLWLACIFNLHFNKRNKRRQGHFPRFPPCREEEKALQELQTTPSSASQTNHSKKRVQGKFLYQTCKKTCRQQTTICVECSPEFCMCIH